MIVWGSAIVNVLSKEKYFRKAITLCHPDKQSTSDDSDRIYISNRCFSALNDAFNEYKNEPGVNL